MFEDPFVAPSEALGLERTLQEAQERPCTYHFIRYAGDFVVMVSGIRAQPNVRIDAARSVTSMGFCGLRVTSGG